MNPALRPDTSLPEFLAARARAASDGRLVVDVIAGCGVALGVAVWRPVGWITLLGAAVSLAAFGVWGIADREIRERANAPRVPAVRVLTIVRAAAVAVGALAAVTAIFAVLGVVLGTWIS
jgi:hypothetical protein